ncbi:uncharacterized protein [Ptychodera flava]|uniref:uncharacterized protein n=1 Tax=Ptychodera flava TaxID=63121 RepID=UPI00396A6025
MILVQMLNRDAKRRKERQMLKHSVNQFSQKTMTDKNLKEKFVMEALQMTVDTTKERKRCRWRKDQKMFKVSTASQTSLQPLKHKPTFSSLAKAVEAEKLRVQKRRESDAKCRANLANCYHRLRCRLPKGDGFCTTLSSMYSNLENVVHFLNKRAGDSTEGSEDASLGSLDSLRKEFCNEYYKKWDNIKNKATTSERNKRTSSPAEQMSTVANVPSHTFSISTITHGSKHPPIQPKLVNTQYITMATGEDSYGLLVTPPNNFPVTEDIKSTSDQVVNEETEDFSLLCAEEALAKLQDDYFDIEEERMVTPDLLCQEDPNSSLPTEEDSMVPNLSFVTPVKDATPVEQLKPKPVLSKRQDKSGRHGDQSRSTQITESTRYESGKLTSSRKRKLSYTDVAEERENMQSSDLDFEDVYSNDYLSLDGDGLRRKVKRQYKKRATAARVRPWNPTIGKVESPVLPYSAFNSTKKQQKKCDASPGQRDDPDFRLNEYHRKKIDCAKKVQTRPLRTSTPKVKVTDCDNEDIDLETEMSPKKDASLYKSKDKQYTSSVSATNPAQLAFPSALRSNMTESEANGFMLFYNQVQKQLEKLLPDSDISEEPFPSTISKMWNDLKEEQQFHLIMTAQALQEMGKSLDESLPSDILSQETDESQDRVLDTCDDGYQLYQSSPSLLTSDFDPQMNFSQESHILDYDSSARDVWVSPVEDKPFFAKDADLGDKLQALMASEENRGQVAMETSDAQMDSVNEADLSTGFARPKTIKIESDHFLSDLADTYNVDREELMNINSDQFLPLQDSSVISIKPDPDQNDNSTENHDLYDLVPEAVPNIPVFELQGQWLVQKELENIFGDGWVKHSDSKKVEDYIMDYVDDAVVDMVLKVEEGEREKWRSDAYSPMLSGNSEMNQVPTANVSNQSLDSVFDDLQVVPDISDDMVLLASPNHRVVEMSRDTQ